MPIYTFICPECGTEKDTFKSMHEPDPQLECPCGGDMKRKFSVGMVWSPTSNGGYS